MEDTRVAWEFLKNYTLESKTEYIIFRVEICKPLQVYVFMTPSESRDAVLFSWSTKPSTGLFRVSKQTFLFLLFLPSGLINYKINENDQFFENI